MNWKCNRCRQKARGLDPSWRWNGTRLTMKILRSAPVQVYIFAQRLDNLLGTRSVLASKSEALFLTLRKVPDIKKNITSVSARWIKMRKGRGGGSILVAALESLRREKMKSTWKSRTLHNGSCKAAMFHLHSVAVPPGGLKRKFSNTKETVFHFPDNRKSHGGTSGIWWNLRGKKGLTDSLYALVNLLAVHKA